MEIIFLGLLASIIALSLAAPEVLQHYLNRLPEAPACPACHAPTYLARSVQLLERLLPALAATSLQACARCGWRGRMRWRWAPHPIRGGKP